jgi:hypothetical protein
MLETQQNLKYNYTGSDQDSSFLEMSSFYSKTIQSTSPGKVGLQCEKLNVNFGKTIMLSKSKDQSSILH